jgi:hypothetical protein
MTNPKISETGTQRWYNEKGELHRDDGPAIIYPNGDKYFYQNGKLRVVHYAEGGCESYDNDGKLMYMS